MTENILNVLPLLKGWEFAGSKQKKEAITEKKSLVKVGEKGYLLWSICSVNDSKAELSFDHDETLLSITLLTANDIYGVGLVMPNPLGLWVSRFDVVTEVFVIAFTPTAPWPYAKSLDITLKPTLEKPNLQLHSFDHSIVKIVDEALFKQGLRDISGAK